LHACCCAILLLLLVVSGHCRQVRKREKHGVVQQLLRLAQHARHTLPRLSFVLT
jgi:hypothetical protein